MRWDLWSSFFFLFSLVSGSFNVDVFTNWQEQIVIAHCPFSRTEEHMTPVYMPKPFGQWAGLKRAGIHPPKATALPEQEKKNNSERLFPRCIYLCRMPRQNYTTKMSLCEIITFRSPARCHILKWNTATDSAPTHNDRPDVQLTGFRSSTEWNLQCCRPPTPPLVSELRSFSPWTICVWWREPPACF